MLADILIEVDVSPALAILCAKAYEPVAILLLGIVILLVFDVFFVRQAVNGPKWVEVDKPETLG